MNDTARQELNRRNQAALAMGGSERLAKQKAAGKLNARERVEALVDPGSFFEFDRFGLQRSSASTGTTSGKEEQHFYGDGVIAGRGAVANRQCFVFSQDFTVFGGSLASTHARKIVKIMDRALETGCPLIGINDSGGARIQEGVESLAGYADIFLRNVSSSGVIPQISLIMGPCAGGAVYSPAITDFVIMVERSSHMFITGPDVIKAVTREEVDKEQLGGAITHASISGVAHLTASSDREALALCKKLLSYIPQNNAESPAPLLQGDPAGRREQALATIIPRSAQVPYDMRSVVRLLADTHEFFEIQPLYAQNMLIGFIRLHGRSVGVVANQPNVLAGCLDINASVKAARFVRFCDAFNIPLLTLVDVPGFLPGTDQEHGGIIRHGAKLLYAFAEATVPKVTLITRKAYGGAYDVMSSKHLRADINLAWPSAEIAVMGPEGAVNVLYRRELEEAERYGNAAGLRQRLIADYREKFANPWIAAEVGYLDEVIEPERSRERVIAAFEMLHNKCQTNPRKKHGNIPL
jgi:propionyl-CoA carboxylase beta chain